VDRPALYRELAPPPSLRAALSCVWVRRAGEEPGPPVRVLPDACVDLVWRRGHGVLVAGPDTAAHLTQLDPGDVLAGVRFAPGAAGAALDLPMDALRDLRVAAEDLDGRLALDGGLTPGQALTALLAVVRPVAPDRAVQAAARHPGPVARTARDLGLSERQLHRRALHAVGYGPKTLARILRFRRYLALADSDGARSLADLALESGYADQAHLTRECTRLAGLPPAQLRAARAARPPAPAPPDPPRG